MKKILVADDDFEQRDLYLELFRGQGFEVISANDGLDALEKSLTDKPDLVFTGIIMPRMDGFELIRNLRNNIATADTPVIMFSHLGREEDRKKAKTLYRVDFMVKGYDSLTSILNKVKEQLDNNPKTKQIEVEDDRPGRETI
jgi:CheY-like chemotaxis protein